MDIVYCSNIHIYFEDVPTFLLIFIYLVSGNKGQIPTVLSWVGGVSYLFLKIVSVPFLSMFFRPISIMQQTTVLFLSRKLFNKCFARVVRKSLLEKILTSDSFTTRCKVWARIRWKF